MKRFEDTGSFVSFYDCMERYFFLLARQVSDMLGHPVRILDMGCGTGLFSASLAKSLPGTEVLGVDILQPFVQVANAAHSNLRVEFQISDATHAHKISGAEAVDVILFKGSFHLIEPYLDSDFCDNFPSLEYVIIIEKTFRSLNSYPVPSSAESYRQTYVKSVLRIPNIISQSANLFSHVAYGFGMQVEIPNQIYREFIRKCGLSYLEVVNPTELEQWLDTLTSDSVKIFEEHVIDVYTLGRT
jgi:SAM-dependent methyltransferase